MVGAAVGSHLAVLETILGTVKENLAEQKTRTDFDHHASRETAKYTSAHFQSQIEGLKQLNDGKTFHWLPGHKQHLVIEQRVVKQEQTAASRVVERGEHEIKSTGQRENRDVTGRGQHKSDSDLKRTLVPRATTAYMILRWSKCNAKRHHHKRHQGIRM